MDIRFVVSNNKSRASPIYHPSKKIVYMVIDLTTGPSDIELSSDKVSSGSKRLNEDFRQFFSSVESQWRGLGGIPHYSKLFGFGDNHSDPFNPSKMGLIFDQSLKTELTNKAQPLFVNQFVRDLIIPL